MDPASTVPLPSNGDDVLDRLAARGDAPDRSRDPDQFLEWAAASDDEFDGPVPLSRYLAALRAGRPDLLDAFPQVPGLDVSALRQWAHLHGRTEVPIAERFVPAAVTESAAPYLQAGVNLAGFLTAELGVGELARRVALALRAESIPFATTTFASTTNRTAVEFAADTEPRFDTNLVCVNADSWGRFAQRVGPRFFADRYTIAVWFWETSIFPSMFQSAFRGVDEIWTASAYVADVVRRAAPAGIAVHQFPVPVIAPTPSAVDMHQRLALAPERPYFLTSFDYNSIVERKNPMGTMRAFMQAFPNADGPALVVKSINGARYPADVARLRALIADRGDIIVHDDYLDVGDNTALLAQAACFVSLHRAEGYGFNIVDAMALGVPVVATGYSGNLTFASDDSTWLVPATEIAVGEGNFPYQPTALWGDPDLATATRYLAEIASDPKSARLRAERGRGHVLTTFTPERTGLFIRNRVASIRAARESQAAPGQPSPRHVIAERARQVRNIVRPSRHLG